MPRPLPQLEGASLLARILFESAVLGPALGLILGLCLLIVLRASGKTRAGVAPSLAVIAIGAAAGITSTLVETQNEVAVEKTSALIDTVLQGDVATADRMIADAVAVSALGVRAQGREKPGLLAEIGRTPSYVESGSHSIEGVQADNATTTRVMARVRIQPDHTHGPSVWMFTWRKESDGTWRLYGLEALRFGLRDASAGDLERGWR